MMIPFLWMLSTSLKTRAEVFSSAPFSFPTGLHWENYTKMWFALPDVTFGTFFQNSIVIASLATIGQLVTCSMAAYAFAVLDFRGKRILFALILATLIIPFQVVLVPNFVLYRYLPWPFSDSGNWIGTNLPLWVWAFFGGAFGTFLLRQFFLAIPNELADAARVDGANPWQIFLHIYVPLARPALATLAIFQFMWSWNDLLDPLIYLRDLPTLHDDGRPRVLPGPVRRQLAGDDGRRTSQPAADDHPVPGRPEVLRPRHHDLRPQGLDEETCG